MKAIQIDRFGPPEVMKMIDLAVPEPGPGQVRIRVHAIGVNYFEALMRADRYAVSPDLPLIPGVEVAGVVDTVGEGVASPAPGTRVAAPMFAAGQGSGGYAQFVVIDAGALVPLPGQVSFDVAAALMVQGLTALHMLRQSPPAGKDILVNAAAGGVGSFLVQLAKQEGARITMAAAGAAEKLEVARGLGAGAGVNYRDGDWADQVRLATKGKGVDIIYETVGGPVTRQSLKALAPGGELLFGALGRFGLEKEDLDAMFDQNQSIRGFALLPLLELSALKQDMALLFEKVANGSLKVNIGGRFPLHGAAAAHRALESRATTGKLVLFAQDE